LNIGSIKSRLHSVFENPQPSDKTAKYINCFLIVLILLNVIAVILATEDSINREFSSIFYYIELVSIIIFVAEYLIRLYICNTNERYGGLIWGRISYIFSPMALIDLAAIVPFFIPFLIKFDLRFIRILRILRILRLLKLARYSDAMDIMISVIKRKKEELVIVITTLFVLIIISSSLMYISETSMQGDKFSSIMSAMWWSVATISTVGYGDIYPVTILGKVLAGLIALLGIGLFALPTAILGAGFLEEFDKRKKTGMICPHCGKEVQKEKC
jgi:voltage-gated potassium channel